MSQPFFSIIIPTLNEERYLPQLLSDLSKQSFSTFEVVIADGNSEDHTLTKAHSYLTKLPSLSIVQSSRRHVCTQRNLGAQKARGEWLIFMDADNRLPPYFLQGIKYRLESDPTDIATCWLQSDRSSTKDKNISLAINYAQELLNKTSSPAIMEALVIASAKAFAKIGGFDENIDLAEGGAFANQALKNKLTYKIYRDPVYTYSFRRFRKYGVLNIVSSLAQNELASLLDIPLSKATVAKLYPMQGGRLFDTPTPKRTIFANNIRTLLTTLRSPKNLKSKLKNLLAD